MAAAAAEDIRHWIDTGSFNRLARSLGVKVIHCSERDTQISDRPKEVDEFVNTWSIEGFREEGTTTAEMGWGTHEKELPDLAHQHHEGPKNQICLARMGMNTWVRSWVPYYNIHGMVSATARRFRFPIFSASGRTAGPSTAPPSTTPIAPATPPSLRSRRCGDTITSSSRICGS